MRVFTSTMAPTTAGLTGPALTAIRPRPSCCSLLDRTGAAAQNRSMKDSPLPGLPTMAALMLSAMIAGWIGLFGPLDFSKIKEWQTLAAAIIAATGVLLTALVAVGNVSKQVRINILGREEDRIQRELPGLRDAVIFYNRFVFIRHEGFLSNVTVFFRERGISLPNSTIEKDIIDALPNTDVATRLRVRILTTTMVRFAGNVESALRRIPQMESEISLLKDSAPEDAKRLEEKIESERQRLRILKQRVSSAMDELEEDRRAIQSKIELYDKRLVRIRREVEAYFGETD
jgi:hypothetical protein